MPNIDHTKALAVLEEAAAASSAATFQPASRLEKSISLLIGGTHLTYKYLLATALLAKATESEVNPLVLQAGAHVKGAYDARSLCHKVIVPHEARLLANGLGGSNEPFLNKPARFKTIALDNPVRAGKDRRAFNLLHAALSSPLSQAEAKLALRDLIYYAKKNVEVQATVMEDAVVHAIGGRAAIAEFLRKLVVSSVHGETSALATAAVFWIMGKSLGQEWTIKVHPVNEPGSSSKEISDIDVFLEGALILTAEVKDKDFTFHDVEHAMEKVVAAQYDTLHFICGPHGKLLGVSEQSISSLSSKHHVELFVLELQALISTTVAFAPKNLTLKEVAQVVRRFADEARVKPETMGQITSALA